MSLYSDQILAKQAVNSNTSKDDVVCQLFIDSNSAYHLQECEMIGETAMFCWSSCSKRLWGCREQSFSVASKNCRSKQGVGGPEGQSISHVCSGIKRLHLVRQSSSLGLFHIPAFRYHLASALRCAGFSIHGSGTSIGGATACCRRRPCHAALRLHCHRYVRLGFRNPSRCLVSGASEGCSRRCRW